MRSTDQSRQFALCVLPFAAHGDIARATLAGSVALHVKFDAPRVLARV